MSEELELTVEGTPDMILECVRSIADKLNSQGCAYGFRKTSGTPDFTKWDKTYFATCAISLGNEEQIGTIKLQLLPKDKTSFKFPAPGDWNSSFGYFLSQLFIEFQRLGFVDLERKKGPLGFRLPHTDKAG